MTARVGLTGGIGSGKSTVLRLFRELGATTISADEIARSLTIPGTPEFRKILVEFGQSITDPRGKINRSKLADIIFNDASRRKILEAILHPGIRKRMHEFCEKSGSAYCILEIPLLIETGQFQEMDRVIVITCDPEIRRQRLQQQRSIGPQKFDQIVEAQLDDAHRRIHADDVVSNDGTVEQLTTRVTALHEKYLELYDQ
jgi:dephospho-CoA kinase